MRPVLFLTVCALAASAAPKQRDWKTGTLLQTEFRRVTIGGTPIAVAQSSSWQASNPAVQAGGNAAMAAAIAANAPRTLVWQHFTVRGDVYRFTVSRQGWGRRLPNVTVNGPIKYAFEKGKFYLLDDDGREFQAVVLEKALMLPPP
ncbi:MAG: hypothetical protein ACLQGV_05195 [Bryobacteraceae bacterium]